MYMPYMYMLLRRHPLQQLAGINGGPKHYIPNTQQNIQGMNSPESKLPSVIAK